MAIRHNTIMMPKTIGVAEAAERLCVTTGRVRTLLGQRRIPGARLIGRIWRLPANFTFREGTRGEMLAQERLTINVRAHDKFHDRFLLVDGGSCWQSGASFKDGARKGSVLVTEVIDAFAGLKETYERMWNEARIVR